MTTEHLPKSDELISDNVVCISENRADCIRKTIAILNGENAPPLHRPDVHAKSAVIKSSLFIASVVVLFLLLIIVLPIKTALLISLSVALVFIMIFFKTIIVSTVKLYQRYADEKTRRRCCFTPSCSEYMLLSIDKYGAYIGFLKGVYRLCRCHYPNGGVDEP